MFVITKAMDFDRVAGNFGFIVAHLELHNSAPPFNFVAVRDELAEKADLVVRQATYIAAPHSILAVVHPRDYIIRDWRSVCVQHILLEAAYRNSLQYLCSITLQDKVRVHYQGRMRGNRTKQRPYFPFRATTEVTLLLVNRDSNGTYQKWQSEIDAHQTALRTNVWRMRKVVDSYTPLPQCYKALLELFCHPDRVICDLAPSKGGFAVAAADLGRHYVGLFPESRLGKIRNRIKAIKRIKNESQTGHVPAPTRIYAKSKAGRLLGWRCGVR